MHYSFERVEDSVAVLIDDHGNAITVARGDLPPQARPGDVLRVCDGVYCVDSTETEARRERIRRLQDLLRKKK